MRVGRFWREGGKADMLEMMSCFSSPKAKLSAHTSACRRHVLHVSGRGWLYQSTAGVASVMRLGMAGAGTPSAIPLYMPPLQPSFEVTVSAPSLQSAADSMLTRRQSTASVRPASGSRGTSVVHSEAGVSEEGLRTTMVKSVGSRSVTTCPASMKMSSTPAEKGEGDGSSQRTRWWGWSVPLNTGRQGRLVMSLCVTGSTPTFTIWQFSHTSEQPSPATKPPLLEQMRQESVCISVSPRTTMRVPPYSLAFG
mmetsp:Transcript_2663/g.6268  ORF Transcript_2663/g.6268 Transcript_2663/m.6268 type:complete len:252 (+) Transcript_2663:644-1399(+)